MVEINESIERNKAKNLKIAQENEEMRQEMEEMRSEQMDIKELQQKLIQRHKQFLLERDMNTNKHILICGYVEKLTFSEKEIARLN